MLCDLWEQEEGRSQGREGGDEEAEERRVEEEQVEVEAEPGAVSCGHGEGVRVGRQGAVRLLQGGGHEEDEVREHEVADV